MGGREFGRGWGGVGLYMTELETSETIRLDSDEEEHTDKVSLALEVSLL